VLRFRWLWLAGLILSCLTMQASARTVGMNVRLGMGVGGGSSPEVIDMSWAHPYLDANATEVSNATSEE